MKLGAEWLEGAKRDALEEMWEEKRDRRESREKLREWEWGKSLAKPAEVKTYIYYQRLINVVG